MKGKLLAKIFPGRMNFQERYKRRGSNLEIRKERILDFICKASAVLADSGEKRVFKVRSMVGQHPSFTCRFGKKASPMPRRHDYFTTS